MSNETWDERYRQDGDLIREPATFLVEQLDRLPPGRALDLAAGSGRNALFLAAHGYPTDAVDSSEVAVDKLRSFAQHDSLPITVTMAELPDYMISKNTYAVILNFYFLERKLFRSIKEGLIDGGMLLFETYTLEQACFGRPRNHEFLLKPNELLHSFSDLHIIYYHERIDYSGTSPKAIASLLAEKRI
jgi:SAM-dependent methyltransferase